MQRNKCLPWITRAYRMYLSSCFGQTLRKPSFRWPANSLAALEILWVEVLEDFELALERWYRVLRDLDDCSPCPTTSCIPSPNFAIGRRKRPSGPTKDCKWSPSFLSLTFSTLALLSIHSSLTLSTFDSDMTVTLLAVLLIEALGWRIGWIGRWCVKKHVYHAPPSVSLLPWETCSLDTAL